MGRSLKLKLVGTMVGTVALFGAGLSLPLGSVQAATPGPALGVYRGAASPTQVGAFSQWLGAPVDYAEDFLPGDSWSAIESPMWLLDSWKGTPYRMVYGVPIIPDSGGSLADGAAGDYNSHFRTLAQNLVADGQGNAILRLGWEFGGGWYHWSVKTSADAANYAAYWRQIVTTMRAVAPNLAFDWNPIWGWQPVDPTSAYPGDVYVDYVGVDVYDQSWISNYTDPVARWNDAVSTQWGLAWQRDFAAAHGKQMSFPEWGEAIRSDGHGGGDDPYFVQQMAQWIAQNNVGYSVYFCFDAPDGAHSLLDGELPDSAAAFKAAFNAPVSQAGGTTGSSEPADTTTTTTSPTTTTAMTPPPATTTTATAPPESTTTTTGATTTVETSPAGSTTTGAQFKKPAAKSKAPKKKAAKTATAKKPAAREGAVKKAKRLAKAVRRCTTPRAVARGSRESLGAKKGAARVCAVKTARK